MAGCYNTFERQFGGRRMAGMIEAALVLVTRYANDCVQFGRILTSSSELGLGDLIGAANLVG